VFIGVLVACLLPFSACAEETIKVGAVLPLSGNIAQTGALLKAAMELAQDIINTKTDMQVPMADTEGFPNHGGAKLELIFLDTQNTPERAMSATEQLITQENVVAVIGAYTSAATATASQAAERLGVPFLNENSTSPVLTERGFEWFFRCTPDDDMFTKNFFEFIKDEEAKGTNYGKTIAMLYENTLWGADVAKAIVKYAPQYGCEIIADIPYAARAANLTSEVQRLKQANADIVMLASYVSDAILIQTTFKDLDYIPPVIMAQNSGHNDPNFVGTVGDLANYILSREVFASTLLGKPAAGQVNEMMLAKTGLPLDGNSGRAIMGTLVLADAINRAKSTKPEDLRQALLETDIPEELVIFPWQGIRFDQQTHQINSGRGIVVQIQDKKYIPVWPYEIAGAEAIYPIPKWNER